jgi:hypothetical protein
VVVPADIWWLVGVVLGLAIGLVDLPLLAA